MQFLQSLLSSGPTLRFAVGTRVICQTADGWQPGRVVALWWRHPDFPADFSAPYQVELESDGTLIFVPQDTDQLCRMRVILWWERLFETGSPTEAELREAVGRAGTGAIDEANHAGVTALLECARLGRGGCVGALLELGANASLADREGRSPLHHAVMLETDDAEAVNAMVKSLLAHRADPNAQDQDPDKDPEYTSKTFDEREKHRSALHYCAAQGNVSAARSLLEAAADPNLIDCQYKTPLHLAIDEEAPGEMVALLLSFKADPNTGNIEIGLSSSYLMVAARSGDGELAAALINARANLDLVGKQGMTALHMAVRARKENVAKLLIEAGCDTNVRANGKTAGELAMTNGAVGIKKLFSKEPCESRVSMDTLDEKLKKDLCLE